LDSKHGGLIF